MTRDIYLNKKAKRKLLKGITKLKNAVASTMGPRGSTVLIQTNAGPHITKDGVSVAREVELEDNIENLGVQLVREVASKTVDEAGDGTTTATVLAHAIFKEGLKKITDNVDKFSVKEGIEETHKEVIEELKRISKPITTEKEIRQIATVSANNDVKIGKLVSEAMSLDNKDLSVVVEHSNLTQDKIIKSEGYVIDNGYMSPEFITNNAKSRVELNDVVILTIDKDIDTLESILPILSEANSKNMSILLIVKDIKDDVLSLLVFNKLRDILKICVVLVPGYGARKKENLKDISIACNSVITDETNMVTTFETLGKAKKVIITKDSTTLVSTEKNNGFDNYLKGLDTVLEETDDNYNRVKIKDRINKLTNSVVTIKVGGSSETDMKERKDRIDDAVEAVNSAKAEGIVVGGGTALYGISKILGEDYGNYKSRGFKIGRDILLKAIKQPLKQICKNGNIDYKKFDLTTGIGIDIRNNKSVDMLEVGIIDPTKVERVALSNAVSIASLLLTTAVVIVNQQGGDLTKSNFDMM